MSKFKIRVIKHSESGKSCFCEVSTMAGPFKSRHGIGYLYAEKLPEIGFTMDYAGDVAYKDMVDAETGELRTTKDGTPLKEIVLA